jgi:hypothetical protein
MASYHKYRIKCSTDNKYEYAILDSAATVPTTCPIDTGHTIDGSQTTIVDTIEDAIVSIKEENTATGGFFKLDQLKMVCPANSNTVVNFSYKFPISVIAAYLISEEVHRGDVMCWTVNPNTTVGALGASYTAKAVWTVQNYVVDDYVWYKPTLDVHGYNYKCILDTVSNEDPTNETYWVKEDTILTVSSTVLDYTKKGFFMTLTDGVNTANIGYAHNINAGANTITVNGGSQYSFSAASPTYVQISIMYMDHVEFGPSIKLDIGSTKIGTSYVPANTVIRAVYENKHPTDEKTLISYIEFLY